TQVVAGRHNGTRQTVGVHWGISMKEAGNVQDGWCRRASQEASECFRFALAPSPYPLARGGEGRVRGPARNGNTPPSQGRGKKLARSVASAPPSRRASAEIAPRGSGPQGPVVQ